jgi:hypothetical protein
MVDERFAMPCGIVRWCDGIASSRTLSLGPLLLLLLAAGWCGCLWRIKISSLSFALSPGAFGAATYHFD